MTNPPEAVSGAATPQTCPKCGEPTFGCGWHTLPDKHWASLECPRKAGQAEPAATPEAQIPKCVHAPEKYPEQKHCCMVCAQKRRCSICDEQTATACSDCAIDLRATVYVCSRRECREAHDKKCPQELKTQLAALRVERDTWKWAVGAKDKQILELSDAANHNRDQAEMWRVERDQAWNEAIEAAAQLVSRIYPQATKYDIERLARPIPPAASGRPESSPSGGDGSS